MRKLLTIGVIVLASPVIAVIALYVAVISEKTGVIVFVDGDDL